MTFHARNSADDHTVIFCTKTNRPIDVVKKSDDPYFRLTCLSREYGDKLVMLSPEEATARYEGAFKSQPKEITAARFDEMLGILPPVAWRTDGSGESFKMCERLAGAITAIYVRVGARYVTFADDIRTPHDACCKRAAGFLEANPARQASP